MRRHGLAAAIALFVVTRAAILFALEPDSLDTSVYYAYASDIARGHTPYTTELPIEYPPVALWAIRAPFAVAHQTPTLAQYRHAFRLEMALADIAAFALVIAIARRRRPELAAAAAGTYVVATAILGSVLYDRLDVALAALVLAWAYAFVRGWTIAAYAALGAAISFKLVPLVIVPVLATYELRVPRRLAVALATGGVTALVPFAVYPAALDVLRLHAQRGVQVESLWASVGWLTARAHLAVAPSFGSYNLVGGVADVLAVIAKLALVALVIATAVLAWRRRGRDDAYRLACACLAGAVIASNVLSPQYLVWALPVIVLLALEVAPDRFARACLAAIAIAVLTAWVFPAHYVGEVIPASGRGPLPATFAHVVIAARNVAYLALVAWLYRLSSTSVAPQPPLATSPSA